MSSRLSWVWALSCFLFITACKKNTLPVNSSVPAKSDKVNVPAPDFTYFSAKGRMQVEQENGKLSSGITMRVQKDSIIWISVVPALGIEAARLKITPDSVYLVNRLQKTFFAGDYSFFREKFKVDVNFAMVQTILLGNYMAGAPGQEKILAETPVQHIRQEQASLLIDQFLDAANLKLKKLSIKDQQTNNSISVDYTQFEQIGTKSFAKTANIVILQGQGAQAKELNAAIDYNKIELDEEVLAFPFSIPSGYTRL